jgi:type II secretory pathway component PulF
MPEYTFKAINAQGKVVNGVSSAQNQQTLAGILQDQGLFLMESAEKASEAAFASNVPHPDDDPLAAPGFKSKQFKFPWPAKKINLKDVAFLTAQLAIMVRSALPIMESLELLTAQAHKPGLKALLQDVGHRVSEGEPLSAAFASHPKTFDEVYISMLSAGEASGDLDMMLERLASHLNFHLKLTQSIRSVLMYPAIVIMTASAVIGFLVVFVLPTFMEVFAQLSIELPLPTRILIYISELLRQWWWVGLLSLFGAFSLFKVWLRNPNNLRIAHHWQLKTPILGELTKNIILTRTLRTMGSLIESGISVLKSLELSKAAAGNLVFSDLLQKVHDDVREGKGLSWAFAQSPHIPPVVVGMMATGERTGTLPEIIKRVAEFYEAETETSIKNLFSALEPIFIVGLGIMVGSIAVSVLLPMFDMAQGIQ